MGTLAISIVASGLVVHGAGAMAADERPVLKDVSSVRAANYGTPSTVINDREQVRALVEELRRLRGKAWRRADTRLSCYATVVLLSGTRTVTLFRVRPDFVVERAPGKGQASHSLAIGEADLPRLGALLARIPPPKDCS